MARRSRDAGQNNRLLLSIPAEEECRSGLKALAKSTGMTKYEAGYRLSDLRRLGLVVSRRERGFVLTPKGEAAVAKLRRLSGDRPPVAEAIEQRLWNAARTMRKWSVEDVVSLAARPGDIAPEECANDYFDLLEGGKLIQRLPARPDGPRRWRMVKDIGLVAPTIHPGFGCLWDWNQGKALVDAGARK